MNYVKSGAVSSAALESMERKGPQHVNVTRAQHRYGRYLLRSTVGKLQPEVRGVTEVDVLYHSDFQLRDTSVVQIY